MSTVTQPTAPVHVSRVRPSRGRVKPRRSVRMPVCINQEGKNGLVEMTVGKDTFRYYVDRLPSDFGNAFRMSKIGSGEVYDVCLQGRQSTCECLGHLRWGHCKHVEALATLIDAGKIAAMDAPVPAAPELAAA